MNTRQILTALAIALVLLNRGAWAAEPVSAFDFITHTEIHIAASPDKVWPYLRNVNAWKLGAKTETVSGVDAVGERFKVVPDGAENSFYFIETAELERAKRWTIRLDGQNGELRGYATWTLASDGLGTRLRYDVFVRSQAPRTLPLADLSRLASRTNADARRRMDSEFARLKALVETAK